MTPMKSYLMLCILVFSSLAQASDEKEQYKRTVFEELLKNPENYHDNSISIRGVYLFGLDFSTLFPDYEKYEKDDFENSISLVLPDDSNLETAYQLSELHGKCVEVTGVFDAAFRGYGGFNKGTLMKVFSIEPCMKHN
ncbi:hypothetical protein [Pseudoalteromonas sp. PPB1]|uniref:hypothetical protein n=1 Tax=Pseudoalteromonas sp. PPB1 TaxID=2756136 RepID=UPI001891DA1C|nr:hypothetical protein [Pseudoalteromonas sp. PPB1]